MQSTRRKIIDTSVGDRYGQEIGAAWAGKERLRDALNLRAWVTGSTPLRAPGARAALLLYGWRAQHDDIPELLTLVTTIARREDEIVAAVITRITNATAESLNRLAELGGPPGLRVPATR